MLRTRVGYAGGDKDNPTYHSLGGHSETLQVDYDPALISYDQLLEVFWDSHDPARQGWGAQYLHAAFYETEAQRQAIEASKARVERRLGRAVRTKVLPLKEFWPAEDYHQKYYLRGQPALLALLDGSAPTDQALRDSTAAARLNAYLGGHLSGAELGDELRRLDQPQLAERVVRLLQRVSRRP